MAMKKNIIIYVGGFELPDKNAAAQRVLSNAKIFRDLGYKVVFIGVDKALSPNTHIKDTRSLVHGFEAWAVPYPSRKIDWLRYILTSGHLKYLISKFYSDKLYGIICYNYPSIAQLRIQSLCQQYEALLISDATEWYKSGGGSALFNTVKWLDTSMRMYYVHPKANGIITTSQYLTNFYKRRGCKLVELPTLYDPIKISYLDNFNRDSKNIKIMYAGSPFDVNRINKQRSNIKDRLDKIIIMLHNVYKKKTNFTFDVYGLTEDNYLSVFPEHKSILDELSNVLTFHGRREHDEIVSQIKKSDFTIFLRNIERLTEAGFPSKFSESISYGTPVICNMISNIEKYVDEGKNCFIISLNDVGLQVKKMLHILSMDSDERKKMKDYCIGCRTFDYRKYISNVAHFLMECENENK